MLCKNIWIYFTVAIVSSLRCTRVISVYILEISEQEPLVRLQRFRVPMAGFKFAQKVIGAKNLL